jgi:hypothetical protein
MSAFDPKQTLLWDPSTSAFEEIVDIAAKLLSKDGAKDCKQYNEVAGVAWRAYDASAGSRDK